MNLLDYAKVSEYIQLNIGPQFHAKKLAKIRGLSLDDIVKRKNPYLFRAKGSNSAHDFISSVLDATVSSGEETTFGNFLEGVAIFVCEQVGGGRKSGIIGMDLEFEDGDKKYLISIKSGPNWGNSGQIKNLVNNFNTAKKTLATSGGLLGRHIVCVEACCYGVDNSPNKGTHFKLCGQRFWELISNGDQNLYREIIEPLGYLARERNDEIALIYSEKLNLFTAAFVDRFCDGGVINWDRLIKFNSGKTPASP
jgi:hypothetical protein